MLDVVAVSAEYDTLGDLSFDCSDGPSLLDHIRDVEIFSAMALVVKLESAIVGETAAFTAQLFLVSYDPYSPAYSPFVLDVSLAVLTAKATVRHALDDPANLE
jgi:hypothetical protein